MSVNDGLSDEEWGAWGKPSESVFTENINCQQNNSKPQNGFASEDEIILNTDNTESSVSKFSVNNYNKENNLNGRSYEKRGGFNGTRGANRFTTRKEGVDNKYTSNDDRSPRNNGYSKDREARSNYQTNSEFDIKKNGNNDFRNSYRNDRNNVKRDDSPDDKNQYRRKDFKREDSRDRVRNNNKRADSRERRFFRDERRDDSRDHKIYNDKSERKSYRDDSREHVNNRVNGRSHSRDRKSYRESGHDESRDRKNYRNERDNSRDRKSYRDDSRENCKNCKRRDDSHDRNDFRRSNGRDRDDSRDRGSYRSKRNNGYDRDSSRENRNDYRKNDDFKRDDSREKRPEYKKDKFKRDESWENRRDEINKDSRENKNGGYSRNERNYNEEKKIPGQNERHRVSQRDESGGFKRNDYISDNFEKSLNLNETDGYSSKTFVRGQKMTEKTNDVDENALSVVKRATFIPNDDQEDYELHVNSGINFDNYDKIPVEVTGDDAPKSLNSFSDLKLPDFLVSNIENLRYVKLTPVQKYAIPIINDKRDLMACAQTGSGKTAAFLIPIIKALNANSVDDTPSSAVAFPKALIMAPTRELCRQIFTAARQLCRGSKVKCAYIYGGIEMNKSRRNIQSSGCDILVATPGRLIHFMDLVWISMKYLRFFVLDEADRMLEAEGFYESVSKIYQEANCVGEDRTIQISMFSATFPNEIQTLARNLLKNYLFLAVGVVGSANSDVKQEIIQSDQREKVTTAIEFIKTIPDEKTLIFVESKRMADFFGIKLGYLNFKATTIHGDREQEQREIALNDFKSGRVNFMVATNVAARGLDIPKVDNVINIDMPDSIDTYVHRIGRTGRCGNVGRAISFFDEAKDIGLAQSLVSKLQEANQECPDWLKALCDGTGARKSNYSRDTRQDVKSSRYIDNPTDNGFMKGTNIDYDDVKPSSEWLED